MCILLRYIHPICTHPHRIGTYTCHAATLRAGIPWATKKGRDENGEVKGFDRHCERYQEVEQDVVCVYAPSGSGERGDVLEGNGWCWECRVKGRDKATAYRGIGREEMGERDGDGGGEGAGHGHGHGGGDEDDVDEAGIGKRKGKGEGIDEAIDGHNDGGDPFASDTTYVGGSDICEADDDEDITMSYAYELDSISRVGGDATDVYPHEGAATIRVRVEELESLVSSPSEEVEEKKEKEGSGAKDKEKSDRRKGFFLRRDKNSLTGEV